VPVLSSEELRTVEKKDKGLPLGLLTEPKSIISLSMVEEEMDVD